MAYRINFDKLKVSQPLYAPEPQQQSTQELADSLFVDAPTKALTPPISTIPTDDQEHTENPRMALVNSSLDAYQKSMGDSEREYQQQYSNIKPQELPIQNVNPEFAAKHPVLNTTLEALSYPVRKVMSTPWVERSGQTGSEVMTMTNRPDKVSTGSKAGDLTADLWGFVMGGIENPRGAASKLMGGSAGGKMLQGADILAEKYLPTLSKPVANLALRGAAQSVPYDVAYGALNDGISARDVGVNAIASAALNALPYGVGRVLANKSDSPLLPNIGGIEKKLEVTAEKIDPGYIQQDLSEPPLKPKTYKLPNTEQEAMARLNEGIQAAQNHVRHNDILAAYPPGTTVEAALADIKKNTGVDLPALIADVEALQAKGGLRQQAAEEAKFSRLGQAAGVIPEVKGLRRGNVVRELGTAAPSELKMNAARAVLKGTDNPAVAARIFEEFPQLKSEFPEQVKAVEKIPPLKDRLEAIQAEAVPNIPTGDIAEPTGASQASSASMAADSLPEGVGAASLKPPDTMSTITSKTEKAPLFERIAPANLVNVARKFYYKTVDGYNRLNDLDKYYVKNTGKPLSTDERTFILAHNTSNAEAIAQRILEDGLVDSKGNLAGSSLKDVVRQVPRGDWRKFEDYLKLNHFKAWEAEGKNVYDKSLNMNEIIADKKIAHYDNMYPWMKQAAQEYTAWIRQFGEKWLVDTGLISPQGWQAMRAKYKDYIPLQRVLEEVEEAGTYSGGGAKRSFADQSSQVKSASETGSERKTIESLETMIEKVPSIVKAAKRNEVMQQVIEKMQQDPEGMSVFGEIVDPKTTNLNFKNIVAGRIGGERVHVRINDLPLLDALTNLSPQGRNLVVEAARAVTSRMKMLTTGINPIFSLGRNVVRDLPMSYAASKSTNNPVIWAQDILGAVVDIVGNREAYQSFKRMGGGQASAIAADVDLLATSKAKLMPGYYNLSNLKEAPFDYIKRLLDVPFSALGKLADVTEMAPRLGEYRRIIRQEGDTYATRQKALFEAKDVTVNFWKTKTAETTSLIDAFTPYFGAAVQGLDKFFRTYKDQPLAALAKTFAAVTVPTLVFYSINHDNPNYQKLSNWVKDTNYLIPRPDGTFIKVPKPREGGVVFGALVERLLRQFKDNDPDGFEKFTDTIWSSFAPPDPIRNSIVSPAAINLAANKDFIGRPIVPGYMQKLSPGLQYDSKNSSLAKWLGRQFPESVSPKKADYILNSYFGIIAQLGIPATSEGNVKDTIKRIFTADPAYSQDTVGKFYEKKQKLDTMYADLKSQDDTLTGDDEKFRKLYSKVADTMSDTNKAMRELQNDKTVPDDVKKEQLRGMQMAIVKMAEIVNGSKGEQLSLYHVLKSKGKIEEAKPKSEGQKAADQRKQQKEHDKMVDMLTK